MENREVFDLLEKIETLETDNKELKRLVYYYEKFFKQLEEELTDDETDEYLTDKEEEKDDNNNLNSSICETLAKKDI